MCRLFGAVDLRIFHPYFGWSASRAFRPALPGEKKRRQKEKRTAGVSVAGRPAAHRTKADDFSAIWVTKTTIDGYMEYIEYIENNIHVYHVSIYIHIHVHIHICIHYVCIWWIYLSVVVPWGTSRRWECNMLSWGVVLSKNGIQPAKTVRHVVFFWVKFNAGSIVIVVPQNIMLIYI